MTPGEIVLEFPPLGEPVASVSRVRSTLITSSITTLRARGLFDAYAANLDEAGRDMFVTMVAGAWLPIDVALKHYRACEALALTHDEALAIGMAVGSRVHDSVLNTVRRLAMGAGVTPWTVIAQFNRLWTRLFDGGAYRLVKTGPKDAVLELSRFPLAELSYFRSAFCGVNLAGLNLFTPRGYIRVIHKGRATDAFAIRASWV